MPNYWNPLLTINGVPCNIWTGDDGQQGHLAESTTLEGGRKSTVRFRCDWYDRDDLIAGLIGTVDYVGGSIVRTPPFTYPRRPNDDRSQAPGKIFKPRHFCTAITDVQGLKWFADPDGSRTGLAGWGGFEWAILTAEFTSPPYLIEQVDGGFGDALGITYAVSELRVSGEVFSPPTGAYRWAGGQFNGDELKDVHMGITRPRVELSVTRVRMPLIPYDTLAMMIGTSNQNSIPVGPHRVTPGAALFMGYNPRAYSDPYHGGIVYDIEMLWLINGPVVAGGADADWNLYLDPQGQWNQVVQDLDAANPPGPFPMADHYALLSDAIS